MSESVVINGITTAFIGLTVVFLGLILLIGVIWLMRFASGEKKPAAAASKPAPSSKAVATPVAPAAPPAPAQPAADSTALAIAITAALFAVLAGEETGQSGFVVRRIRRY
ncbi:MAG: OadG family protein [Christensenellaceae bacterium]|nr:OadG family protein [Christensenellaceae bacterium]